MVRAWIEQLVPVRPLALGLVLSLAPLAAQAGTTGAALPDLVETLLPAVATITATHAAKPVPPDAHVDIPPEILRHFLDPRQIPDTTPHASQSLGSGFVIDPTGYIVTNNHVIADAATITVTLADAGEMPARLVGTDTLSDLALLKVEPKKPLATLAWGDSDTARIGETVIAIGNPFGLGGTVTAGILSARARDIGSGPYDDFLQTDASINRGNSGGPLLNTNGEVIGINTAIYAPPGGGGSVGIGFAIPSAAARGIVAQLEKDGAVHRGLIGVEVQEVTQDLADELGLERPAGALVTAVQGPAEAAGIKAGDVIIGFAGKPVADYRHLPRMVAATPATSRVAVDLWRKHAALSLDITVAEMPPQQQAAADAPASSSPEADRMRDLGIELAVIDPDLREQFGLGDDEDGIVVTVVDDDSDAAEQGMRPGDIVRAVAMDEVSNLTEVGEKITKARAAGESTVLLLVDDDGDMSFVDLPLKKPR